MPGWRLDACSAGAQRRRCSFGVLSAFRPDRPLLPGDIKISEWLKLSDRKQEKQKLTLNAVHRLRAQMLPRHGSDEAETGGEIGRILHCVNQLISVKVK